LGSRIKIQLIFYIFNGNLEQGVIRTFLDNLPPLPPFATWIRVSIVSTINDGDTIDKEIMHMSMPSTLQAMLY
jgi:hypothetical protein